MGGEDLLAGALLGGILGNKETLADEDERLEAAAREKATLPSYAPMYIRLAFYTVTTLAWGIAVEPSAAGIWFMFLLIFVIPFTGRAEDRAEVARQDMLRAERIERRVRREVHVSDGE